MNRIVKLSLITWGMILAYSTYSCNQLYKAGNLNALLYPVETPLRSIIIMRYLDTLIQKDGYNVPDKWMHYDKLVDLDSINNKRIYFKSKPEEMYLLSFGGMFLLSDIYNPDLKDGDWVSEKRLMTKEQELRVSERLKNEILDKIEKMAKRDGLPDSVIYKQ